MRILPFLLTLAVALPATAQSLPDLFRQGQEQFKRGDYRASSETFSRLAEESRKPGFESDRARLEPVLTFFAGANAAMLGDDDTARDRFLDYLVFVPRATIDERAFPRQVVRAFADAREEYEELTRRAAAGDLQSLWGAFSPVGSIEADETWANSAVRYLLTDQEKERWASLTTSEERAAFVEQFWDRLDSTPGVEGNPLRDELESRMLFADRTFTTAEVRGRDSDRGLIFTLLGPPSFIRGAAISSDADAMEVLRTRGQGTNLGAGHQTRGADRQLFSENSHGRRESWYYRGDRKPGNVPFNEVRFDFVTRTGYGNGVLEKDSNSLIVIGRVSDSLKSGGVPK